MTPYPINQWEISRYLCRSPCLVKTTVVLFISLPGIVLERSRFKLWCRHTRIMGNMRSVITITAVVRCLYKSARTLASLCCLRPYRARLNTNVIYWYSYIINSIRHCYLHYNSSWVPVLAVTSRTHGTKLSRWELSEPTGLSGPTESLTWTTLSRNSNKWWWVLLHRG